MLQITSITLHKGNHLKVKVEIHRKCDKQTAQLFRGIEMCEAEQTVTKQSPHVKPPMHEQRSIPTEEATSNGQETL